MSGSRPLSAMGWVPTRPPVAEIWPPNCHSTIHQAASPEMATAFNMIVEITSFTPRVTLRTPAAPAKTPPTAIATAMMKTTCSTAGSPTWAPRWAATMKASRYWPSTPMLNRFMRKPMATAMPDRYSGVARFNMSTWVSSLPACPIMSAYASTGLLPETSRTIEDSTTATTSATSGAAEASRMRRDGLLVTARPLPGPLPGR